MITKAARITVRAAIMTVIALLLQNIMTESVAFSPEPHGPSSQAISTFP
jgi:hypothetical protein